MLVFQSFYSAGQGEVKKALRLEHHLGEKKPKIIFPGEFIQYKKLKSHSLEEGVIKEVTDTSLVFTNFVEVKFDELKYIRKHSIFKGELGIGLGIGSGLIAGGVALTITGSDYKLGGLTALGIILMVIGTPIAATTGYPFFAIKTHFDLKKYKASSVTASELMRKKEKVIEL